MFNDSIASPNSGRGFLRYTTKKEYECIFRNLVFIPV